MNETDNYLKNAELSTEQNYNMIDGIFPCLSVFASRSRKRADSYNGNRLN